MSSENKEVPPPPSYLCRRAPLSPCQVKAVNEACFAVRKQKQETGKYNWLQSKVQWVLKDNSERVRGRVLFNCKTKVTMMTRKKWDNVRSLLENCCCCCCHLGDGARCKVQSVLRVRLWSDAEEVDKPPHQKKKLQRMRRKKTKKRSRSSRSSHSKVTQSALFQWLAKKATPSK